MENLKKNNDKLSKKKRGMNNKSDLKNRLYRELTIKKDFNSGITDPSVPS